MALSYKQSVIVRFEYYLYQIGKFWDPIRGVYKKLHAREKVLSDNLTPHPHPDENPNHSNADRKRFHGAHYVWLLMNGVG